MISIFRFWGKGFLNTACLPCTTARCILSGTSGSLRGSSHCNYSVIFKRAVPAKKFWPQPCHSQVQLYCPGQWHLQGQLCGVQHARAWELQLEQKSQVLEDQAVCAAPRGQLVQQGQVQVRLLSLLHGGEGYGPSCLSGGQLKLSSPSQWMWILWAGRGSTRASTDQTRPLSWGSLQSWSPTGIGTERGKICLATILPIKKYGKKRRKALKKRKSISDAKSSALAWCDEAVFQFCDPPNQTIQQKLED